MKKPDYPADEASRVGKLHAINILDTQSEDRFDRLTRLAKRIYDVPIALVSLVDTNRQWFKSCVGLDVSETPRDISFCGHAILGNDIFVIPDASLDPRFSDNPLVLDDPNIRFYAGCPLRHIDGDTLGTLCIIDTRPRRLNESDLDALRDLAGLVEHELMAIQLATLDDLTGISNRRGFMTLAENNLKLSLRNKSPVTLISMDLNDFKKINDEFGHAEGDLALIVFAEKLKQTFRESDILARMGGDEFLVLLTGAPLDFGKEANTRLRLSINEYNSESQRGYEISYSEGILGIDCDREVSLETLLNEADLLMYKSKRNC